MNCTVLMCELCESTRVDAYGFMHETLSLALNPHTVKALSPLNLGTLVEILIQKFSGILNWLKIVSSRRNKVTICICVHTDYF